MMELAHGLGLAIGAVAACWVTIWAGYRLAAFFSSRCWLGLHDWIHFTEHTGGSVLRGRECARCRRVVGKYEGT